MVVGGYNTIYSPSIGGITAGSSAGDYTIAFAYGSGTPIPEPGVLALIAVGTVAAVVRGRHRQTA